MSRYLSCAALASVAMCFSLVVSSGCDMGAKRVVAPTINSAGVAKAAVDMYGKDGKIAGEDLDKCPALKDGLGRLDKNGDGAITAEEIANEFNGWKAMKIGRVVFSVLVNHNGKPLAGATVKFVPEKFLGADFPAAVGTTNDKGMANMLIKDATPPGLALGFYRVEITKDGESIPAQYNTETTLGLEVSSGSMGPGKTWDLKY